MRFGTAFLFLVLSTILATPARSYANPLFTVAGTYVTGPGPQAIVNGDLNLDGRQDLVVANMDRTLSVHLGKGDGSFAPKSDYGVGGSWATIAIADLNNDTKPDLISAGYGFDSASQEVGIVSVLLGNGDGGLAPQVNRAFAHDSVPKSIAAADLNGDGKADLAIADTDLHILLGAGDGSFAAESRLYRGVGRIFYVAVAYLDADQHPDLVVTGYSVDDSYVGHGFLTVLLGTGDGNFAESATFWSGVSSWELQSVAISDLNRDGNLDLVTSDGGSASLLLGNGDGTFVNRSDFVIGGYCVAAADLNRDGNPDLIQATVADVSIAFGDGDGNFEPWISYAMGLSNFVGGTRLLGITTLNEDGKLDLAVVAPDSDCGYGFCIPAGAGHVIVLLNMGPDLPADIIPLLDALTAQVRDFELQRGTYQVLRLALLRARSSWNAQDVSKACRAMADFDGALGRDRSRNITADQTETLRSGAQRIERIMGCEGGARRRVSTDGSECGASLRLVRGSVPSTPAQEFDLSLRDPRFVRADIIDIAGRRVRQLSAEERGAGIHRLSWDGRGPSGMRVAAGLYFLRVSAGTDRLVTRIVVLH